MARKEAGRRCAAADCSTVLSIYNPAPVCFVHAEEAARSRFERRYSQSWDGYAPMSPLASNASPLTRGGLVVTTPVRDRDGVRPPLPAPPGALGKREGAPDRCAYCGDPVPDEGLGGEVFRTVAGPAHTRCAEAARVAHLTNRRR